jgi:hypothetical protein
MCNEELGGSGIEFAVNDLIEFFSNLRVENISTLNSDQFFKTSSP